MAKRKKRKKKGAGGSERGVRNISELRTEISYIRTQKETCLFSYKLPLWPRCIVVDRVAAPYFSIIARVRCATGRLFAPISLCRFTPGPPAEFKHKEKKRGKPSLRVGKPPPCSLLSVVLILPTLARHPALSHRPPPVNFPLSSHFSFSSVKKKQKHRAPASPRRLFSD